MKLEFGMSLNFGDVNSPVVIEMFTMLGRVIELANGQNDVTSVGKISAFNSITKSVEENLLACDNDAIMPKVDIWMHTTGDDAPVEVVKSA